MALKVLDTTQKHWLAWIVLSICLLLLAGCTASPTTPPPPSGGEPATYQIEIVLLSTKTEASVDSQGKLKTSVQVTSADGAISLSIDADTILLDKDGKPLQFIQAAIDPTLPLPPEGAYIVGAVYVLRPHGATFNPPLKLTISYDPEELPGGVRESNVYIAPYDEGTGWGMWHYKRVDTENHRVTTQVNYFARFAILAPRQHPTSDTPLAVADRVEVVYFHRAQRCAGCIYAETATRFTLETYFADELAEGKIVFKLINLGDKANAAIVEHYGAYTSSLFINSISGGIEHIEEVKEIWFLLGNDREFVTLVKSKIDRYLSEEKP